MKGGQLLTSQESPVYWEGQEQSSTVFAGLPVPEFVASSRPTSPKLSLWVWVKYRAWILKPTRPAKTIMSSSLDTGLLVPAWCQFPCKQKKAKGFILKQHCGGDYLTLLYIYRGMKKKKLISTVSCTDTFLLNIYNQSTISSFTNVKRRAKPNGRFDDDEMHYQHLSISYAMRWLCVELSKIWAWLPNFHFHHQNF